MTVFGNIVTPTQVEIAIRECYERWSPTYLRQMERETGRPPHGLPDIASWRFANSAADRFPEQQIPAVQIMLTPDIQMGIEASSAHAYMNGTVDVLVQSTEPEPARELASIYAYHLGLISLQQNASNERVKINWPIGWEKLEVPAVGKPESRWLALGSISISVYVNNFATPRVGPTEPDEELPPEYPVGETHHLKLEPES